MSEEIMNTKKSSNLLKIIIEEKEYGSFSVQYNTKFEWGPESLDQLIVALSNLIVSVSTVACKDEKYQVELLHALIERFTMLSMLSYQSTISSSTMPIVLEKIHKQ